MGWKIIKSFVLNLLQKEDASRFEEWKWVRTLPRKECVGKCLSFVIRFVMFCFRKNNFEWYFAGNSGEGVERLLPNHISPDARDLLATLLQYDPELRPTAHRAMSHPYFKGLREAARKSLDEMMPGDVTVSIGTAVKTLSEVDGMLNADLRTLGDVKPKVV